MRVVIEGGGCRSVYSSGVLEVLAESGLPVESVVGSSSGAMNAAFFAAGQAKEAAEIWRDERVVRRMVSIARFINPLAPPGLDIDDLVDNKLNKEGSLDPVRATTGDTRLYTMAVNIDEMLPVAHRPNADNLWDWLKASMAMPLAYNRLVQIDGKNYVDGGVLEPVPYKTDLPPPSSGVTVVMLTRRAEVRKPAPPVWARWMMRLLTDARVYKATLVQHTYHNNLMDELVLAHEQERIILCEPPRDMPVSRLTTAGDKLQQGYEMGRAVGEELVRTLEKRLSKAPAF